MNHGAVLETKQAPGASICPFLLLLNRLCSQLLFDSSLLVLTQTLLNVPSVFYGQCSASISFFAEDGRTLLVLPLFVNAVPLLAFYFQLCITHSVLSASTPSLWVQCISKGFVLDVCFVDDRTAISRFNHLKQLLDMLYSDLSHTVSAILHQQALTTQAE